MPTGATYGTRLNQYKRREQMVLWVGAGWGGVVTLLAAVEVTLKPNVPASLPAIILTLVIFGIGFFGYARVNFEWAATKLNRMIQYNRARSEDELPQDMQVWPRSAEICWRAGLYTLPLAAAVLLLLIWWAVVAAKPVDLSVIMVSFSPSSAKPGDSVVVSFTVINAGGSSSGQFSNEIFLATNIDGMDISLGNFSMGSLGSGASHTRTTNVTIPRSVSPGSYWMTVFTDSFRAITEGNKGNNVGTSEPFKIVITIP